MRILSIETSCDETAGAVIKGVSPTQPVKVLSSVVASSEEMHKKTGGIVPEIAAREQLKCIIPVVRAAVQSVKSKAQNIDAIAVAVGPGLVGSLLVGVETARSLAYAWEKPIIPVNHLVAHLYANFVGESSKLKTQRAKQQVKSQNIPEFPAIGLVVSGGHTDLVVMEGHPSTSSGQVAIKLLGRTRDDAAGECFDKCARILGLPYPGGPAIAAEAAKRKAKSEKRKIKLPRPLMQESIYDFSFSGLKTAVARIKIDNKTELAYEIQEAIVEVLVERVMRAVEEFRPKSVLLGGGVAANSRLRESLSAKLKRQSAKLFIPEPELCTDNAVVIGAAAYYNYRPTPWQKIRVNPGWEINAPI
ncbi:MAG: tRNA (adenosine(37)-N6)-threonylcarbamoyltransferase complex transferase subunit TsaD [Candidatus Chisholmbacteria bacterium]|nr:tRNA (adenosine(37)-N6)-threonylcarbamoyltransferase complex transferase subunit TsaD [Candidatus Chisholmbacteria bacterium]